MSGERFPTKQHARHQIYMDVGWLSDHARGVCGPIPAKDLWELEHRAKSLLEAVRAYVGSANGFKPSDSPDDGDHRGFGAQDVDRKVKCHQCTYPTGYRDVRAKCSVCGYEPWAGYDTPGNPKFVVPPSHLLAGEPDVIVSEPLPDGWLCDCGIFNAVKFSCECGREEPSEKSPAP